MRTTITLDDDLFETVQRRAHERGVSVSGFVRDAIRSSLGASRPAQSEPFRLVTFGEGGPAAGLDLDRISDLLTSDDEAGYRAR